MSQTETQGQDIIDVPVEEVKQQLPKEAMPLAIVPPGKPEAEDDAVDYAFLTKAGFITPVADPMRIRKAFAWRQKIYASVLDERDFIYSVSYQDGPKTREKTLHTIADAKTWADKYKTQFKAAPKKSGIAKLAMAFGIEAARITVRGLPDDPNAKFSYVVYDCVHPSTGRKAEGIGWCDLDEKNGYISRHDCIATADTRAFNRGILRLLGFGDVSAEEILTAEDVDTDDVHIPDDQPPAAEPASLPSIASPEVQEAATAWAEAAAARPMNTRFLAPARQTDHEARSLRGAARLGDAEAARKLGSQGYEWKGPAQLGERSFVVAESPVDPRSIAMKKPVPQTVPNEPAPTTPAAAAPPPETKPAAATPSASAPASTAAQQQSGDQSELAQALLIDLSTKLMTKFNKDKEKAKAWLVAAVGVDSVKKLNRSTYEKAAKALLEVK